MAGRKDKNVVDYFPKWNPQRNTILRIKNSMNVKDAFEAFRNSSSSFIANKKVRSIIFKKYNYKCAYCCSVHNLQIDHKISVAYCFYNGIISYCNTEKNLQVLCSKCNASKKYTDEVFPA